MAMNDYERARVAHLRRRGAGDAAGNGGADALTFAHRERVAWRSLTKSRAATYVRTQGMLWWYTGEIIVEVRARAARHEALLAHV